MLVHAFRAAQRSGDACGAEETTIPLIFDFAHDTREFLSLAGGMRRFRSARSPREFHRLELLVSELYAKSVTDPQCREVLKASFVRLGNLFHLDPTPL